jgi:hypothetical protein
MAKSNGKRKIQEEPIVLTEKEITERIKDKIQAILSKETKVKAKNESQKELIRSIKDREITICTGPAGSGKAQPLSAFILGKNGYIRMGDVKINDEIFTENGKISKINGIFPQGKKDSYIITFSDGSTVECCDEHLWYVYNNYQRNSLNSSRGSVKTLKEIINNYKTKSGKLKYSIPIVKPIEFEKKYLEINPYLLGILIGDGSLTTTIRISSADEEIINECNKVLPENYKIKKINSSKYDYSILNEISNKKFSFRKIIEKVGILNLKSENKFIPKKYLMSSIEDRINLLQGLMDSDGYIDSKGTYYYSTVSNKLFFDIKQLIESLGGIINPVKTKIKKYKYNGIIKEGKI